eukprot:103979-Pleurochrysis_carterae.AAC.2
MKSTRGTASVASDARPEPYRRSFCRPARSFHSPAVDGSRRLRRVRVRLLVGRYEIPSAHREAALSCERCKCSQRCGAHSGAKGLLVVDTWNLRAALNAEPRFERAISLTLVDPYQTHESSSGWDVLAIDEFPASVVRVVGDFRALSGSPASSVVTQGLLARFWVGACCGSQEGTTCVAREGDGTCGIVNSQQRCGLFVAEASSGPVASAELGDGAGMVPEEFTGWCDVSAVAIACAGGASLGASTSPRDLAGGGSRDVTRAEFSVRLIGGVGGGAPSVLSASATNEGHMRAMSAREGREPGQCRL